MKDIVVLKRRNKMENMENVILAGIKALAPLMNRNYSQELKGDEIESEIDTEMEFPIEEGLNVKWKLKMKVNAKIEYMKLDIVQADTKRLGLGDEA